MPKTSSSTALAIPSAKSAPSAVKTSPAQTLQQARGILLKHDAALCKQLAAFEAATLANKLCLGLACYQAHIVFAVTDPKGRGAMKGKTQKLLTREQLPDSFAAWLEASGSHLKEAVAYKYMQAFRGLGLDEKATERQLQAELKRRLRAGEVLTLKGLIAACVDQLGHKEAEEILPGSTQLTFEDYQATLKAYRLQTEDLLDRAAGMPAALKKSAIARAYATLHALTGSWWQPSDTPDELASIDPDTITV